MAGCSAATARPRSNSRSTAERGRIRFIGSMLLKRASGRQLARIGSQKSHEVYLRALDEDFFLFDQRCCLQDDLQELKETIAGFDRASIHEDDGVVVADRCAPFGE